MAPGAASAGAPRAMLAAMRRRTIAIAVVVGVVAVGVGAFVVDTRANEARPARRLEVAGRGLGGLDADGLRSTVAEVAAAYRDAHVHISSPAGDLDQTAAAVGLTLDEPATVSAILAVDRGSSVWTRPLRWLRSLFVSRAAPLVFHVDQAQLTTGVSPLWQANHVEPVEPGIAPSGATMAATPSAQGEDIDLEALAGQLVAAAATGTTPISVDVAPVPTNPRFTDQDAVTLAAQATDITRSPLAVQVNGRSVAMQPTTVRSWLRSVAGPT